MLQLQKSKLITLSFNLRRSFSTSTKLPILIQTNELETLIKEGRDDLTILNSAMAVGGKDLRADHIRERIKGSIFLDLDEISD